MLIIKMIIAACTSYCFYRDSSKKDNKSIYVATLGLFVVMIFEMIEVIKELR